MAPQLLSHTLSSAPIYLDDPSPLLLLTPPTSLTHLLTTTVDHTSPPTLAETLTPVPLLGLLGLSMPLVPVAVGAGVVGYRFVERRLDVGVEVVVVGRVVRRGGGGAGDEGEGGWVRGRG